MISMLNVNQGLKSNLQHCTFNAWCCQCLFLPQSDQATTKMFLISSTIMAVIAPYSPVTKCSICMDSAQHYTPYLKHIWTMTVHALPSFVKLLIVLITANQNNSQVPINTKFKQVCNTKNSSSHTVLNIMQCVREGNKCSTFSSSIHVQTPNSVPPIPLIFLWSLLLTNIV